MICPWLKKTVIKHDKYPVEYVTVTESFEDCLERECPFYYPLEYEDMDGNERVEERCRRTK